MSLLLGTYSIRCLALPTNISDMKLDIPLSFILSPCFCCSRPRPRWLTALTIKGRPVTPQMWLILELVGSIMKLTSVQWNHGMWDSQQLQKFLEVNIGTQVCDMHPLTHSLFPRVSTSSLLQQSGKASLPCRDA